MRNWNSFIVPNYLKLETLRAFGTLVCFKVSKQLGKWDPQKAKKIESRTVPKKLKEGTLQSRPLSQMLEKVYGQSKDSNP